jgi:hypothetical protein
LRNGDPSSSISAESYMSASGSGMTSSGRSTPVNDLIHVVLRIFAGVSRSALLSRVGSHSSLMGNAGKAGSRVGGSRRWAGAWRYVVCSECLPLKSSNAAHPGRRSK